MKDINSTGIKKYFFNTTWLMSEKVLRLITSLFIAAWVAQYLGPKNFGALNYSQTLASMVFIFASFGIDSILVKELVGNDDYDKYINTAFFIKLFGALISSTIVLVLAIIDHQHKYLISIFALLPFIQSLNVIDLFFQSRVLNKYVVYGNIVALIISSGYKFIGIFFKLSIYYFAWGVILEASIISISLIIFFSIKGNHLKLFNFDLSIGKRLIKNGIPLLVSGIFISLYTNVDKIMIEKILGSSYVGMYTAATKISQAWYFIPYVICLSLFPAIISAKKSDEKIYLLRLERLTDLVFWGAVLAAFILTFLSKNIINILYGQEYFQSSSILIVHVWSGIFVSLGLVQGKYWIANGLQNKQFFVTLGCCIINIILNYFLIKEFGAIGAAYSTLISYASGTMIIPLFFSETKDMMKVTYKAFLITKYLK